MLSSVPCLCVLSSLCEASRAQFAEEPEKPAATKAEEEVGVSADEVSCTPKGFLFLGLQESLQKALESYEGTKSFFLLPLHNPFR